MTAWIGRAWRGFCNAVRGLKMVIIGGAGVLFGIAELFVQIVNPWDLEYIVPPEHMSKVMLGYAVITILMRLATVGPVRWTGNRVDEPDGDTA